MKYLFILIMAFFGLFNDSIEPKINLKGSVNDKNSKEKLIAARVSVHYPSTGFSFETVTDTKGNYSLSVLPGFFTIHYTYDGYSKLKKSLTYRATKDTVVLMDTAFLVSVSSLHLEKTKDRLKIKEDAEPLYYSDALPKKKLSTRGVSHYKVSESLRGAASHSWSFGDGAGAMSSPSESGISISDDLDGKRVKYASSGIQGEFNAGTLTAGEINDFSKWILWNDLNKGELSSYSTHWGILPKHRFAILITNEDKFPVCNVKVVLKNPMGMAIWESKTDNTGKAELWAGLFDSTELAKGRFTIEASYNGKVYKVNHAKVFHQEMNKLIMPADCKPSVNMDIVFAVDATGSMGDEIRYLQAELADVIEKVKQKNPGLSLNMGSVFYRDKEDEYLTVQQDITSDIHSVLEFINKQGANGGGDEPEAVDDALEVAINKFSWREDARARVLFLLLDASPHHEAENLAKIKKYTELAAKKGIRIVPIVCSGIDKAGEYLMRSMALATNGNYVFLTDHSGIGNGHIAPSTDKYEVETLNLLLIRLLQQYIFMPECNKKVITESIDSLQKSKSDSIKNDSVYATKPLIKDSINNQSTHSWFLKYYPNPCKGILHVELRGNIHDLYICDINGKILMNVPVSKEQNAIEIDLTAYPSGIYFLRYGVDGSYKSGKFVLIH